MLMSKLSISHLRSISHPIYLLHIHVFLKGRCIIVHCLKLLGVKSFKHLLVLLSMRKNSKFISVMELTGWIEQVN